MQEALDEKKKFELLRDVAEHNAMFWNPEGVRQIRDSRENTFKTPDSDFHVMLKDSFGRDADLEKKSAPLNENDFRKKLDSKSIDPYLDMDLDEINFIPFNEDN